MGVRYVGETPKKKKKIKGESASFGGLSAKLATLTLIESQKQNLPNENCYKL
jgi:hypothetical protein